MLPIHSGDPYVYLCKFVIVLSKGPSNFLVTTVVDVMNVGGYGSTVTLELTSCTPVSSIV